MTPVKYTGQVPIHVVGYGDVEPGQMFLAPDHMADALLARPDFEKKTRQAGAVTPKKAKAPAKATDTNT